MSMEGTDGFIGGLKIAAETKGNSLNLATSTLLMCGTGTADASNVMRK